MYWEWIWLSSVLLSFFGVTACKKSNVGKMTLFFYGTLLASLVPILFGMAYYAGDVYKYATKKKATGLEVWKVRLELSLNLIPFHEYPA